MLSKMAKPKEVTDSYNEIIKTDLNKSKLPELKSFAKSLHLKVSGTKADLAARIRECLTMTTNVIKIQRNVRRFFVSKWFKLKGTPKGCVNESDFYTLEPLDEIPYLLFFQHTDQKHNYGFNLKSLFTMTVKNNNNKFENPYNRDNMKPAENKIVEIVKLTNVLFPANELINHIVELSNGMTTSSLVQAVLSKERRPARRQQQHQQQLLQQQQQEQRTIDQRITAIFMHIDQLGNYTQMQWLTTLTPQRIYYMIVKISQLWHALPRDLRSRICPRISPFSETIFGTRPIDLRSPLEQIMPLVVGMAETLVFSGIDPEHQNLGAMYFLTGLTIVSLEARIQMPWLYDNFFTIVPTA